MNNWLICLKQQPNPKLRLFCFAYAGGSAWSFRPWAKQVPESIEVCAIELPGRGKRLIEPALTDLEAIIQAVGPQMLPLSDVPFAFFGHSMGALIAFELSRWLRRSAQLSPLHFWASAARAPHLPIAPPQMHKLPKKQFIDRLKHYGGTPLSVLNNAELMELMLPTLKADFTLLETYHYQPQDPFDFPITGLWGTQDEVVSKAELAAWQVHVSDFQLAAIAGDHFFIQQQGFIQTLLPQLAELTYQLH
ncbi:MAG: alpha/beta fold hydrolase [Cyanobacteria bacterium J06621_11]